ncbi:hypothetical protein ADK47_22835 [Streptomyces rimosus subsp. rimosus]|nr:hypothetical protein DF17_27550 [Streptomyces rimosus]KOG71207.1 hypothetical protein ADK78_25710 [Kitasatospora aureofaciens]KOT33910.1 hypothetical protein ADK84_25205 [Streptomyces sp. NRRL WC-3701]KOT34514.1 hypothetical protein ADK42_22180 [Streptomyces rimosus subsp. rimosus]KOT57382.1 hypothetical protein ADK44_21635 [Streptomyces rimosus subsp. rimosus]
MVIFRARKTLTAGVISAAAVIAGVSTHAVAQAAPQPMHDTVQQTADDAPPPYAVETFDYPNAAKILKEHGIALRKGDGHIVLADCNVSQDIVVRSTKMANVDDGRYCFRVTGTGKAGYLTLEVPEVVTISTGDYLVHASLTADKKTTNVKVPKNDTKSVGEGTNPPGDRAVLVELRVAG